MSTSTTTTTTDDQADEQQGQTVQEAAGINPADLTRLLASLGGTTRTQLTGNDEPDDEPDDEADEADDTDDDEPEGRGSKAAVLADLAAERDRRQTAETELAEFRTRLAELFGVELPGTEAEEGPTASELEEARAQARAAQVELAVVRNAPEGVDVAALLDSTSFMATVKDTDPTDHKAITAKVERFAARHPRFTVTTTPERRGSTRDASSRTTTRATGKTMDDLIRGL